MASTQSVTIFFSSIADQGAFLEGHKHNMNHMIHHKCAGRKQKRSEWRH